MKRWTKIYQASTKKAGAATVTSDKTDLQKEIIEEESDLKSKSKYFIPG